MKRTPLYAAHVRAGARMVPFGGWEMPVQYRASSRSTARCARAAGLFDVSHMGEFEVAGPGALAARSSEPPRTTSRRSRSARSSTRCCATPDGGIVDDLTVYRLADDHFMLTVNAANIDKDWAWVGAARGGRRRSNERDATTPALLAVQGPQAEALVGRARRRWTCAAIGYYRFRGARSPACRR